MMDLCIGVGAFLDSPPPFFFCVTLLEWLYSYYLFSTTQGVIRIQFYNDLNQQEVGMNNEICFINWLQCNLMSGLGVKKASFKHCTFVYTPEV